MEEEKNMPANKKKGKTIVVATIIILLIAIIGALAFAVYSLMNKPEEKKSTNRNASEGLVIGGNISEKKRDARFTTDMNMVWSFPSGSATSTNAHIGNSTSNQYECFFEIYLNNEEQTLLYSSPVLPVGTRLEKLTLDQVLPDGNYDAMCTFHILDDENPDEEIGKVSFNVDIVIAK